MSTQKYTAQSVSSESLEMKTSLRYKFKCKYMFRPKMRQVARVTDYPDIPHCLNNKPIKSMSVPITQSNKSTRKTGFSPTI